MKLPIFLLPVVAALLAACPLAAQVPAAAPAVAPLTHCLLLPLDPAERPARATRIVEAAVTESQGFRAANGRFYTRHRLRVFQQFKGPADSVLTLLTEGGTVGLSRQELTNTLQVEPGEQGIFFLEPATLPGAGPGWQAYGSQQGFIRYELPQLTATEPFRRYEQLDAPFYQTVAQAPPQRVQPNPALAAARLRAARPAVAARGQAPVIVALAPLSLPAGTGAVLTITGSGFGPSRGAGSVEFRNADDGGATFTKVRDDDYVRWTDTQIQVRVPSLSASRSPAGTGPVRVTTAGQLTTLSPVPVTIVFAAANVLDTNSGQRAVPNHRDLNSAGGMTFRFDAGFAANMAAAAAWQRALGAWRCQTGINWNLGAVRTATGVANDGDNSVGFDTGTSLPAGVLGRTTSYYEGCYRPDGSVVFFVREVDTEFDDATNWQFGPANPAGQQIDFETVAVHELGHAQQLSHLILPSAIMHYAIARGQRSRELAAASDVAGGRFVLRTRSFRTEVCGPVPMLPAPVVGQQATFSAGSVVVQWATRDECNLSGFVVERAPADTTAGWQAVATVVAGNANNQYRVTDAQPLAGLSYYRLRVRRPDNSLDDAYALGVTTDATAAGRLRPFPNPLADQGAGLGLQYGGGPTAGTLVVRVYDAVGRYLGGTRLDYLPGLNLLRLNLPPLRAGYYLLRWTDTNGPAGTEPLLVQ
ncbi:matrixin family metalloprotease [Hymenobacter sp. NST-14]|uniref:matrixin family metalloprotease n=1 Tax=Hymenobacter piscis TaxID=2839984 RepID=UPI001C03683B|nr:matrixin family metalloprotease [Hymenobacter piscis]MBT9393079.1 matrixin family metalloprotease [Hymenobacter piscis]